MVRLPTPGSDSGNWGDILNQFLDVEHNTDGTLKQTGAITQAATNAQQALQDATNAQTAATTALSAIPAGGSTGQVLAKASNTDRDTTWVAPGGAVSSVNAQTGAVVLDADDISDSATTNKFATAAEKAKLAGIEAGADVTDAANVAAAGAVMQTAALGYVDVSTGSEARPNNARVIWIGGTTQPTNMQNLDVWLKEI